MSEDFKPTVVMLERQADRKGWDQPPALYALLKGGATARFPLPEDFWRLALPRQLLNAIADTLTYDREKARSVLRMVFEPSEVVGIAFMTESWIVNTPKDGLYGRATVALAEEHRLHEHRDRVEARTVYVVMRNGTFTVLNRERGRKPEWWDQPQLVNTPDSGVVPQIMDRLVKALV